MSDIRPHKSETYTKLKQIAKFRNSTGRVETLDSTRFTTNLDPATNFRQTSKVPTQYIESRRLHMRRNIDINMLTTTRLPDIEPAVPPDTYLQWRYMHQRGATNMAFDRCNQILKTRAQNAIESFERKLKLEDARLNKVKKQIKEQNKNYNDKVNSARSRWIGIQGRQANDAENRLAKSNAFYNQSLKEIKDRFMTRTQNDSTRSRDHQMSIQSARDKRLSIAEQTQTKETKRVTGALNSFSANQQLHYVRADSARSERVSSLAKHNMDWEKACESQMSRVENEKFEDFKKDFDRQKYLETVVTKNKEKYLKKNSKKVAEQLQKERRSFSSQSAYNSLERAKFEQKVDEKMQKIDKCNAQHQKAVSDAKIYQQELNTLRSNENMKGKEVEKAVLTSIKERVWKQHKTTYLRRKKALKEVAPPSTFEIYTMNQTSRSIRNSFTFASPTNKSNNASAQDPNNNSNNPVKTQTTFTPLNLRNPLVDYSLRLALSHTAKNPFRLNQKKVQSMIQE